MFLSSVIERIQLLLSQSYKFEIIAEQFSITLGHIISKIELKEFTCDWGYLCRIHIKGSLPPDIYLGQGDCFSAIISGKEGILKFDAGISGVCFEDGETTELLYTSIGRILVEFQIDEKCN